MPTPKSVMKSSGKKASVAKSALNLADVRTEEPVREVIETVEDPYVFVEDGVGEEEVSVPSAGQGSSTALTDYPLATIVCLTSIDPPPTVGKYRFPEAFKFEEKKRIKVPTPVAKHLSERGVAAILVVHDKAGAANAAR